MKAVLIIACMVVVGMLLFCGAVVYWVTNETPTSLQQKQTNLCDSLVAQYHSRLDAAFEVEMRHPSLESDWFTAVVRELDIRPYTSSGMLEPSYVVNDVLGSLRKMSDVSRRQDLEYRVLGSVMPLEARRQFDQYCVASTP